MTAAPRLSVFFRFFLEPPAVLASRCRALSEEDGMCRAPCRFGAASWRLADFGRGGAAPLRSAPRSEHEVDTPEVKTWRVVKCTHAKDCTPDLEGGTALGGLAQQPRKRGAELGGSDAQGVQSWAPLKTSGPDRCTSAPRPASGLLVAVVGMLAGESVSIVIGIASARPLILGSCDPGQPSPSRRRSSRSSSSTRRCRRQTEPRKTSSTTQMAA